MNKLLKTIRFFLYLSLGLFFSLVYAGSTEVPEIKKGKIIFMNGKIVQYQHEKILFSDPEEALRIGRPVSISEEPKLIQRWKRVIVVRTLNYYEGAEKEIAVYDYAGNILSSPKKIEGEVFFTEAKNRIFLAGQSTHHLVSKSVILDQNGNLVREVSQLEDVFDFGFSQDGEIIWILSGYIKEDIPVGQVKVIDSDGNEIKNIDFLKAMEIEVTYKGKTYKITLPQPDFPG